MEKFKNIEKEPEFALSLESKDPIVTKDGKPLFKISIDKNDSCKIFQLSDTGTTITSKDYSNAWSLVESKKRLLWYKFKKPLLLKDNRGERNLRHIEKKEIIES